MSDSVMFDEWRQRRELKKQIATLKKEEAEVWAGFVPEEPGDKPPMPPRLQAKLHLYGRDLDELETERLLRKAYRPGIKITSQANWWYEDTDYEGRDVAYLTDIGKAGVARLIRDQRAQPSRRPRFSFK